MIVLFKRYTCCSVKRTGNEGQEWMLKAANEADRKSPRCGRGPVDTGSQKAELGQRPGLSGTGRCSGGPVRPGEKPRGNQGPEATARSAGESEPFRVA